VYVALIPITMRHVGREAVRITTAMAWKALMLKHRQPTWGPKEPRVPPPERADAAELDAVPSEPEAVPVAFVSVRRTSP
jgi:hypothetical protein